MTYRQQFGMLALLIILIAATASGPSSGGDGPAGTADIAGASRPTTTARPPPPIVVTATYEATYAAEQEIKRTGDKWAPLFAVAPNPDVCRGLDNLPPDREVAAKYMMGQPACEQVACKRHNWPIPNCTPLSPLVQKSFEDATVQDVVIKGGRAAANFSNGQVVEFVGGLPGQAGWGIVKVGGAAGRGLSG